MKLFAQLLLISSACVVSANVFSQHTPTTAEQNLSVGNPFFTKSSLPFQAPAFDKIKNSDFKGALEAGMKAQLAIILKIADNPQPPTFGNTLIAMEKSNELLERVDNIFNLLTGANTNPELQKLDQEIAPMQAAHTDAIYLNTKLFNRIARLYAVRSKLNLDTESKRLIEFYYQKFVLAGAQLSDADKTKLKKLNEQEASLSAKFTNQLLAASKAGALVVDSVAALAGLSPAEIAAAARDAKAKGFENKWLISLQNTTQQPALQSLTNRATRQKLFDASWNRSEKNDSNDTRTTIASIAMVHAKKAKLIGFQNFATWKLQNQMAKTPAAVQDFFAKLVPAAVHKAQMETADIQAMIDKENGGFTVAPWDWNYYAEKVRKEKYDLDDNQLKPYFELNSVLEKGVFYAANLLYGLSFKERHDLPVYQPDVRVFEVLDKDNATIGLFYCDYYKRDNKSGGAWMSNMVGQSKLLGTKPVIYNVCNFPKPAEGQPALIGFDNVRTMFHEFGHALHGFFANQQYPGLSGTKVARDFVEFPSQFNEHWALDPKVLSNYAKHYETGEALPQLLIDKIKKAETFNQGYKLTEALAASALDMQWNTLAATDTLQEVDKFEKAALKKTGLDLFQVPPRYRSSYFSHIWGSGYAAGYYAYQWTEMLEDDIYTWFKENGGLTRANGERLRTMILSKGNTEEYGKMFRAFRGKDPSIRPMQQARGLIAE